LKVKAKESTPSKPSATSQAGVKKDNSGAVKAKKEKDNI